MKIGFVIDDSLDRNDGVQQYVRTLGGWLETQGHDVQYLAGQSQPSAKIHSIAKNISVKFNGNKLSIPLPASPKLLRGLLMREKFDVLHVQMPYSPQLAGVAIKNAPITTAIVGTFHILPYGPGQAFGNRLLGLLERRTLKRFDKFCFVSPAAHEFAKQAYGITGPVIPNMIDVQAWSATGKVIKNRLVFLGRHVTRKGCKELLLALAALPDDLRSKLEVVIGGDGPQRPALMELAAKLGLSVQFLGFVPEADKKTLLASAQFAVFPSLSGESFGIVLLEAMAATSGVVIGGQNPGYQSVLHSVPECLIDFKDTKAAAQKMAGLLSDKQLQERLHAKQQQLIANYDVNTVGNKVMAMYNQARLLH